MVAITGQASSDKLHKEAHQVVDIVRMLEPVTKWNTRVERVEAIPEIVRKAFRVAILEKPGPTHIELPENLAATAVDDRRRAADARPDLLPRADRRGDRPRRRPHRDLAAADRPRRQRRPAAARRGRSCGRSPAASTSRSRSTFMGKGAIDDRSHLSLMAVGLQARDHVLSGFDRADLVICVGYDLVEYAPARWNPDGRKRIVHIDTQPAEVDAQYRPEVELIGDIDGSLRRLLAAVQPRGISGRDAGERHEARETLVHADLRTALLEDLAGGRRRATPCRSRRSGRSPTCARRSGPTTSSCRDVGAHKVWVARLYQAYEPNTVIISNGFAAMGISLPGAIAAKLVHPDRQGRRAVRRRRVPDEQPGARDREADRRRTSRSSSGATTATG